MSRGTGVAPAWLTALAGSLFSIAVWAAPQTFNNALPVAEGEFVFREQFIHRSAGDDPGPADRDLSVTGAASVLGYGVSSDFAVFGILPYLDKRLELTPVSGMRTERRTRGIADTLLLARYTAFRRDGHGETLRIAPFFGVELPTGDNDDRDAAGKLPAPLQLGSGSWDLTAGAVLTRQTLDYEIDAQFSYKLNTEADGFRFGDELRLDGSFQYRLWPRQLSSGTPGFLYGSLEANLLSRQKNRTQGISDPDSGGLTIFLSPGLQYVTARWVIETVVQLPVVQDLNGQALKDDFIWRGGFRLNF